MHRRGLFALALPALLRGADPLVGRWRSVTTTRGGIGAVYDFRANGTASYSSAALVDAEYKVDGDFLTYGEQTVGVGWHPDGRMQLRTHSNEISDYTRVGRTVDAAKSVLGEWKGSRMMGGQRLPVSLLFHPDNRMLMVIHLRTVAGGYGSRADGVWSLALPSLPPRTVTFDPASGQLTITVTGGDPHPFTRF